MKTELITEFPCQVVVVERRTLVMGRAYYRGDEFEAVAYDSDLDGYLLKGGRYLCDRSAVERSTPELLALIEQEKKEAAAKRAKAQAQWEADQRRQTAYLTKVGRLDKLHAERKTRRAKEAIQRAKDAIQRAKEAEYQKNPLYGAF